MKWFWPREPKEMGHWQTRALAAEQVCKRLEAQIDRDDDRYQALLAQYHELVKLVQPAEKPTLKPKKADPVLQAISDRAGNNGLLRRQLAKYAMDQRRKKVPDDEIVAVISGPWHNEDDDEDESAGVPA